MIEILQPGPLATIQDRGRPGYRAIGVGSSGAADQASIALGNRLVGNSADAAAIEATLGGLSIRLRDAATVAVTGAMCGGFPWGSPITLPAGAEIVMGVPASGLRTYLCVRGGIAVPPVLGSRSTDLLSGLGPAPLRPGDLLPVGQSAANDVIGAEAVDAPFSQRLLVVLGPRADWFADAAVRALTAARWTVRADSDRIGIRLDGPLLERSRADELRSEPMLPGAIQVPPDGRPIILGPDAPVTGGYPVIAVIRSADLDAVGQLRPGDRVTFSRS